MIFHLKHDFKTDLIHVVYTIDYSEKMKTQNDLGSQIAELLCWEGFNIQKYIFSRQHYFREKINGKEISLCKLILAPDPF